MKKLREGAISRMFENLLHRREGVIAKAVNSVHILLTGGVRQD